MGKRIVCVVLLGLLFLCQGCGAADPLTLTQSIFTIELGDSLDENPSSYLQTKNAEVLENAKFNFKEVDTSQTGVYRATVSYQSKREEFKIEVKDTIAPEAGIKQTINGEAGKPIYARDMITELTELSGTVEIQFKDHTYGQDSSSENENIDGVDCNKIAVCYEDEGEFDNTMSLKDESGNSVEIPIHITISMNPIIAGTKDITVEKGTEINYLDGVTATDCDGNDITDKITVDDSAVDLNEAGEYEVTYSVQDAQGRIRTEVIHVIITENSDKSDVKNTDSKARKQKNEKKVETDKNSQTINQNSGGSGSDNNVTNEEQKTQENEQPKQPEIQKESTEKVDNNQDKSEKEPPKEETVKEEPAKEQPAKEDPAKEDPQNPGTDDAKNSESNPENSGTSDNSADSEISSENASDSK